MKRCRHCSRTLGGSASVCPGCGRAVPSAARRWTAAIVAFLFVLALILALLQALAGKDDTALDGRSAPPGSSGETTAQQVMAPPTMETPADARGLPGRNAEPDDRAQKDSHPGIRTR